MNEQELKEKIFRMDGKINELTISNDTLQTVMKVKDELIKRLKDEGKQCCKTCKHYSTSCGGENEDCFKKYFWTGECYSCVSGGYVDISKMKCDEWEAR